MSKIRFLEAQGLINPGRTPAGYRQFSGGDVALLRWILLQQREHYLPLKVIKRRLRDGEGPDIGPGGDAVPPEEAASGASPPEVDLVEVAHGTDLSEAGAAVPLAPPAAEDVPSSGDAPSPGESAWYLDDDPGAGSSETPVPEFEPPRSPVAATARRDDELWEPPGSDRTYSPAELAREAGIDEAAVAQLASFGLVRDGHLDDESLRVARVAAGFFAYGVEARHLRMYKTFAEREAALFEQAVMPMANSRQEDERARAGEALADLARLGQALRLAMLRAALTPPADG